MRKSPKKTVGKIFFQKHWQCVSDVYEDWLEEKAEEGLRPPLKPWLMKAKDWLDLLEFEKTQHG